MSLVPNSMHIAMYQDNYDTGTVEMIEYIDLFQWPF